MEGSHVLPEESRDLTPAQSIQGRCVLIVDDDSPVRETLAELLELSGFNALQAHDAWEALLILKTGVPVDVLVTDFTMPGEDGISLIRRSREIVPGLPAILLTGYAEEIAQRTAAAGECFHVLPKPVHSDQLAAEIDLLASRNGRRA